MMSVRRSIWRAKAAGRFAIAAVAAVAAFPAAAAGVAGRMTAPVGAADIATLAQKLRQAGQRGGVGADLENHRDPVAAAF